MFGGKKIKIADGLYERLKQISEKAGYSSIDEFVSHILEQEIAKFEGETDSEAIKEKLQGLGYL
ncbi:MAG: hypothetical protein JXA60_02290 [Candidatus Coatesbacteria bacterium]|nr:hypothetical protein [Candidatus Coatesbacteria bacterium]